MYPTVSLARVQVRWLHSRCRPFWALRARGSPRPNSILPDLDSSLMVQGLSHRPAPSSASTLRSRAIVATHAPIATGPWSDGRALDTRATAPPGPEQRWCKAPPAHNARPVVVAPREIVCDDPVHRHLSPSRGALSRPTLRASPGTARAVCDTAPPAEHG